VCAVNDCPRVASKRGWCTKHYQRWRKTGDAESPRLRGPAPTVLPWMRQVLHTTDKTQCVVKPDWAATYMTVRVDGHTLNAHIVMCTWAHGPKPSAKHQVAHTCGNSRCINPYHIRWATPSENHHDKTAHGTVMLGEINPTAKITEADVIEIRQLVLMGKSQRAVAVEFNISQTNVSSIVRGKTWGHVTASIV
jgi:HNH endonuclease